LTPKQNAGPKAGISFRYREDRSYSLEGLVSVFVSGDYCFFVSVFVSDFVSVVSVLFFFPVFLVCFLVVFFLVAPSVDAVLDSVDWVWVPVTGFVDDFVSVFDCVEDV
jgi:hypothetical protein